MKALFKNRHGLSLAQKIKRRLPFNPQWCLTQRSEKLSFIVAGATAVTVPAVVKTPADMDLRHQLWKTVAPFLSVEHQGSVQVGLMCFVVPLWICAQLLR